MRSPIPMCGSILGVYERNFVEVLLKVREIKMCVQGNTLELDEEIEVEGDWGTHVR